MKLADPTLLKHQCLIDGAWVGEGVDAIHNPATGALIAKVPRFGYAETVRAIEAAEKAFGPWAKTLPKERAKILRRWFDLIIANRDDVALIMTSEQGKPLAEARGEVGLRCWLHRILRRGGEADLRRDQPDLSRRFAHRRPQAADRRRRRDHAVELSRRDDHPQARAGAGGRLHGRSPSPRPRRR